MRSAIIIDHGEITVSGDEDHNEKTEAVEEAVAELLRDGIDLGPIRVEEAKVDLAAVREDWEEGEPCPECGNEEVSVMNLSEDRYSSVDGEFDFRAKGDAIGPDVSHVCGSCVTFLKSNPVTC